MSYRRLVDGIILNTLGSLAVNFFGILIGIIRARYLGPEVLGTFFLISNIPLFLANLLSLGLNEGLNRFVAEVKGTGKVELLFPLLQRILLIRSLVAFVAIFAFSLLSDRVGEALKIQEFLTLPVVLLVSVWIFFANINPILLLVLHIEYEQVRINLLNVATSVLTLVVLLGLVFTDRLTILNLILLSAVLSVLRFAVCLCWMKGRFQRLPLERSDLRRLFSRFVRYSLVLYAVQVMGIVLARYGDVYFIGYFLTPASVSFYLLALSFSTQLYQLVRTVPTAAVLLSTMVDGYEKGGLERLNRYLQYLLLFTALYTVPIMIMGVVLSKELILVFYGKAYMEAASLLAVFLIVGLFTTFGSTLAEVLKVLGKQHYLLGTKLIAILNIPLFILLLPRYGLMAAVVTGASTHVLIFLVETFLVRRTVKVQFPWRKSMRIVLAGVLMGVTVFALGQLPIQQVPLKLALRIVAGCWVYTAIILRSHIFEPEALRYFPPYLRRVFSGSASRRD